MLSMPQVYDTIIIGGGAAGLTAGLFLGRARRKALLIEREVIGGQIANADRIENYPGIAEPIGGFELAATMEQQASESGMEITIDDIERVDLGQRPFRVVGGSELYLAQTVIVTSGARYRKLGVPGEDNLYGRGVSYCATCDGHFFTGQPVAVVGGGDAAFDDSVFMSKIAGKVTIIHRREEPRASAVLQERVRETPNVELRLNSVIAGIEGGEELDTLLLKDARSGAEERLPVSGLFVYIGSEPNTQFLGGQVKLDNGGHVLVNEWMESSVPGLYAAGAARANSARQVVTVAGDGATAAIAADRYLRTNG
jgi:thioredoxin reductase (NADPH)